MAFTISAKGLDSGLCESFWMIINSPTCNEWAQSLIRDGAKLGIHWTLVWIV